MGSVNFDPIAGRSKVALMQATRRWGVRALAALAALVLAAGLDAATAWADPAEVSPTGRFDITGAVDLNLSSDDVLSPVVIGADVFYGLQPDLDIGLVHTSPQRTGFLADRDGGLCLGGETAGCSNVYDQPGVLARYQLAAGDLAVLAEGGLLVVSLSDPFAVSLKLGVRLRWSAGALFIDAAPNLFVGLAGRTIDEAGVEIPFNEERIHLPVDIGYQVTEAVAPFLQLGIAGPLADFGDAFNTPVGAGVRVRVNEQLEAMAWLSFLNLVNREPELELATDLRSGGLAVTYRH